MKKGKVTTRHTMTTAGRGEQLVPERSWSEIKAIATPPYRWFHVAQEYYKQSVVSEAGVTHEFFLPYFLDSTGKLPRGRTFKHIVVQPATAADLSVPTAAPIEVIL